MFSKDYWVYYEVVGVCAVSYGNTDTPLLKYHDKIWYLNVS